MGSSAFNFILIAAFGFLLVSADHGCHTSADCGEGGNCINGDCHCKKDYTPVHDASPMCQKIANLNEHCQYSEQCNKGLGGLLTKCNKGKCECHDTETNRDHAWDYQGTCYRAVAQDDPCISNEQCKASIHPSEYVQCVRHHEGSNLGNCKCIEGKKCDERTSGAIGVHAGVATIGLVLLTAMKVVL